MDKAEEEREEGTKAAQSSRPQGCRCERRGAAEDGRVRGYGSLPSLHEAQLCLGLVVVGDHGRGQCRDGGLRQIGQKQMLQANLRRARGGDAA